MRLTIALALAASFAIPASAQSEPDVTGEIREMHERMIVLDTHLDIPMRFDDGQWDFSQRNRFEWDGSQVDLPRMIEGGLDGGMFVIYLGQGDLTPEGYREARDRALVRAAAIHRVIGENRDAMGLALTAEDAEQLVREGRRVAFLSMENSWPLGEDLSLLRTFHRLGVRMAGPVHSRTNQFADSTTGEARWNGLSPLGRQWVAEMNRLGIVIDGSHSSDTAIDQMIELSRVPIVLSHHGARVLYDHPRNTSDERMRRLAASGGVLFLNMVFLAADDRSPERSAIERRQAQWDRLSPEERRRLMADKAALDAQRPFTDADFETFMRAALHIIRVMGVDHVGLGADWDGGGGVVGLEDIAGLPRITARLLREGYSEADIAKIMGGNLLRVLRSAQAGAEPEFRVHAQRPTS
ncbi:MAG: dipeptidase [Sphingomonas sp.]|nr:dipeptidase [Sphingomonas sp.]